MRKVLTALAAIIVVVIIGAGAVQYFQSTTSKTPGTGGNTGPSNEAAPQPVQPDWCPAVEFISAPGTWESAADDDPLNPTANPRSFMLSISNPLKEAYAPEDVKVWTLPYTAQFQNINSKEEMTYDDSRNEGLARLEQELQQTHADCPQTKFIIGGFSQGAVIAGDVANRIGSGNGVVPAESVAGVALVADGRRKNGEGINPGVELGGTGAEIALEPISALVQPVVPGATMRGPRAGGFGTLSDRTWQICAPDDAICDAPLNVRSGLDRALALIDANGVHAMYAYNQNVIPGTTADKWMVDWAKGIIDPLV
ncbi:cutinase family protein [Corynebacterium endometrii]|uniref:Cutinase n=1 Tax=Corynebacterium endometrii TaxID=2488819 RepID=A0A4P7QIQ2_9CORY|nr:cutinase family protein [Corynebacterium endometrii]QCB29370.1 Cutinase [Corynebacterium endometrii]